MLAQGTAKYGQVISMSLLKNIADFHICQHTLVVVYRKEDSFFGVFFDYTLLNETVRMTEMTFFNVLECDIKPLSQQC
jgi:hypothetical protein